MFIMHKMNDIRLYSIYKFGYWEISVHFGDIYFLSQMSLP